MYYCYILYSAKSKKNFVSSTGDLKRDFKIHNEGGFVSSKGHRPWKLIWYCGFIIEREAEEFERFLKSHEGKEFIEQWIITPPKILHQVKPQGAKTCPICGGAGKANTESFFKYGKRTSGHAEICKTCGGKGWTDQNKTIDPYE